MAEMADHIPCSFCRKNRADYKCPRCASGYCSVSCYKDPKHLSCSESFYKEWCEADAKATGTTFDSKQFLERMKFLRDSDLNPEELDSDDDPDEVTLEERLEGIDLDDSEQVWNSLTDEEKAEFRNLIQSGAENALPPWEPWWLDKSIRPKVIEIIDGDQEPDYVSKCPPVIAVPPLTELRAKEISPLLPYSVMNVVYAYVVTQRFLLGDFEGDPVGALEILVQLSASFFKGTAFSSLSVALRNVEEKAKDLRIELTDPEPDLTAIVEGPEHGNSYFVKSILSDIYGLTKAALSEMKKRGSKPKNHGAFTREMETLSGKPNLGLAEPLSRAAVKNLTKKLEFYISWTDSSCWKDSNLVEEIVKEFSKEDEIKTAD